jgi:hypothetical protein
VTKAAFVRVARQAAVELKAAVKACGWPCFLWAAGVLLPLAIGLKFQPTPAQGVTFAGIVLQGIALVPFAYNLASLRRDHEQQGVGDRVRASLERVAGARLEPASASVLVTLGPATVSAHGGVADLRVVGNSPEERLAEVERRIKDLDTRVESNARALRDAATRRERQHAAQLEEQRAVLSKLRARTENALVGGLLLQWVAVWWLVAATVMQALPDWVGSAIPAFVMALLKPAV